MITRPISGQIVRLYGAGLSLRAVAAKVKVSAATVRLRLIGARVILRPRGGGARKKAKP